MESLLIELNTLWFRKVECRQALRNFLSATMDESRMIAQNELSFHVLKETNMEDWEYFRESTVKREINSVVSYEKQRDHGSHTVNNYLLGCYIHANSRIFKEALNEFAQLRRCEKRSIFNSLWGFVSLLHDIGYTFEGNISTIDLAQKNELINIGVDIVSAYFDRIFWSACGIYSIRDKEYLLQLAKIKQPIMDNRSIFSITNSLCDLGELSGIIENTNRIFEQKGTPQIHAIKTFDAFDLWLANLDYYNQNWKDSKEKKIIQRNPFPNLINRFRLLQRYFDDVQIKGYKNISSRSIDHAVASGLILQKCATLFFQILQAVERESRIGSSPPDNAIEAFIEKIKADSIGYIFSYDIEWWWTGITWATMAVAYHNFPLMKEYWPDDYDIPKLSYKDDPLTFLGILVDILQEWDRYSISNSFLSTKKMPLQGSDMKLGTIANSAGENIIIISYPHYYPINALVHKLDETLCDWKEIITIQNHNIPTVTEMEQGQYDEELLPFPKN